MRPSGMRAVGGARARAAVAADGTAYDLQDAAAKRAVTAAARRTTLIAERAAFSRSAMAAVCPLTDVDSVVTDDAAPADTIRQLHDTGVRLLTVPANASAPALPHRPETAPSTPV